MDPFIAHGRSPPPTRRWPTPASSSGATRDPERTAVVVANSTGGVTRFEEQALALHARGHTAVSPLLLPGMLPNMATARIAIKHGIRGFSSTIATACASGAYAVAEALRLIREGRADVVVCGGARRATAADHRHRVRQRPGTRHRLGRPDPGQPAVRPATQRIRPRRRRRGAGGRTVRPRRRSAGRRRTPTSLGWGVSTDAHHPTTPSTGRGRRRDGHAAGPRRRGPRTGRRRLRQRPRHRHQTG